MSKNSEYVKAFRIRRRIRIREYLGNKCAQCDSTENLQVDHINPKLKSFTISDNLQIKWSLIEAELQKCQLLCKDCHRVKTSIDLKGMIPPNKGRWEHGTTTSYTAKGCRCNESRTFYSRYKKSRRLERGWK